MKRAYFAILFLSLTGCGSVRAQTSTLDSLLAEGARLYENSQYIAARDLYQSALDSREASGVIAYNLGTVYYQIGQIGESILYYERAAEYMPDHPDLNRNLRLARERIQEPIPSMPAPFWQRWWTALLSFVGTRRLFLIGLGLYLAVAGMVGYGIWAGSLRSRFRRIAVVMGLLASAVMAGGLLGSWQQSTDRRTVVLNSDVELHVDPAANSTAQRRIPEGTVLIIMENLPEWQHVQLPNGATGWVAKSAVGEI